MEETSELLIADVTYMGSRVSDSHVFKASMFSMIDPCHLVRVHNDVPGAALSIVVAIGVIKAGEGARLSSQLLKTTTP